MRLGDRQSETDTGGAGIGAYGPPIVWPRTGESEIYSTARMRSEGARIALRKISRLARPPPGRFGGLP